MFLQVFKGFKSYIFETWIFLEHRHIIGYHSTSEELQVLHHKNWHLKKKMFVFTMLA